MISRREIIDTAAALDLTPHVVEKDYVLGWMLYGIHNHSAIGESWLFKGGAYLKKCFLETYRFFEDFDFTLSDPAHTDEEFLASVLSEVADRVHIETGIEFPPDARKFEIYKNCRGQLSCRALALNKYIETIAFSISLVSYACWHQH